MKHETLIQRPDGTKIKLIVGFWADSMRDEFGYTVQLAVCQPRKRTFIYARNEYQDDYEYRALNKQERQKFVEENNLKYVTAEEIYQAKIELWNKIKPAEKKA